MSDAPQIDVKLSLSSLLSSSQQVHPEITISNKAMSITNEFVYDIFERLAKEVSLSALPSPFCFFRADLELSLSSSKASVLANKNAHATITARDIQTAVRLILPGEL